MADNEHAVIGIDYTEWEPDSYRGLYVDIGHGFERFKTDNVADDIERALHYIYQNGLKPIESSSVDSYIMDVGQSLRDGTVERLYTVRVYLRILHDISGRPWRRIASRQEFGDISHTTLMDIANGHDPSAETCRRLGIRKTDRHRRCADFGTGPDAAALAAEWDAYAARYGGLTGLCRGILDGKYRVEELNNGRIVQTSS